MMVSFERFHSGTADLADDRRQALFFELPAEDQSAAWGRLREQVEAMRFSDRAERALWAGEDPPELPASLRPSGAKSSRTERVKTSGRSPGKRDDEDQHHHPDRLREIPTEVYFETLAGRVPDQSHKVLCPLHEERTPSCHLYSEGWWCFGCQSGSDIYDLAAAIWGLDVQLDFRRIRARLGGMFA